MAKKAKEITNGKDVALTFKKFWNTSEINNSVLNAITRNNKEELIKLMKVHGLSSNFNVCMEDTSIPILTYATMLGNGVIARWLASNKEIDINACGGSALEQAINTSNMGLLNCLLKHGADANVGKGRLLILAAKKNLLGAVEALINHGAKIDKKIKQELFDAAHRNGNYDLMKFISDKISTTI